MATPEPHADYAVQADAAATTTERPSDCARVAYVDDKGRPYDAYGIRIGEWDSTEHCFPNLCMATFCPCVTLGQIAHRLGGSCLCAPVWWLIWAAISGVGIWKAIDTYTHTEYEIVSQRTDPWSGRTTYHEVETSAGYGKRIGWLIFACLAVAVWTMILTHYRTKIRRRYSIPRTAPCLRNTDCFLAVFCYCCMLAQMAAHIKSYKPHSCHILPAVDVLPPCEQDSEKAEVADNNEYSHPEQV